MSVKTKERDLKIQAEAHLKSEVKTKPPNPPIETAVKPAKTKSGPKKANTAVGKVPSVQGRKNQRPRLASSAKPVSAAAVRASFGVSREFFARMTGFSVRAITDWEAGKRISEPGLRRLKEMVRLQAALAEGMQTRFIPEWLATPCESLGGLKPVEALERGEVDRLWRTILLIGSGMPI